MLVAAALPRDGELCATLLAREGYAAQVCTDLAAMTEQMNGAGLGIVTEELLDADGLSLLSAACAGQPPWSDLPLLVFTSAGAASPAARLLERLAPLGNVTLLERPVRMATLLSAVAAALRSRRRQYDVRSLLAELEEGVLQRDRFLAMLGHELRNPLSAVLTAAHVADVQVQQHGDAELAPAVARQHAIIRRQGQTLTRLMDDLLDVSRLRTGKIRVARAPVDLRDVLVRVSDTMGELASRRGITLLPPGRTGALPVLGDVTRLEQVFHNLLHNALKYTRPGGEVRVEVREPDGFVEIAFRDTGSGIEPHLLPRIFDLFGQVDQTLDRSEGGLGLGLTLARSLAELHGGTLTAESEGLGRGSTFVVRLPRHEGVVAARDAAAAAPQARARASLQGLSVFVLEDREDNCEAIAVALGSMGCDVACARDGAEGADLIVRRRPRVALVDIGLPGLDGYAVAQRVRSALGRGIFLVALTGYGQEEDRKRAVEAGFDLHLTKPADMDRIAEVLSQLAPTG